MTKTAQDLGKRVQKLRDRLGKQMAKANLTRAKLEKAEKRHAAVLVQSPN